MRFLFATDGQPGAEGALEMLLGLPLGPEDEVVVLGVPVYGAMSSSEMPGAPVFDAIAWERDYVERLVNETAGRIRARDVRSRGLVSEGPVASAVLSAAAGTRADLIVIGSRGRGVIGGAILGSVAREVSRQASTPVLVVRERRVAPTRILVAVDGSEDSTAAIDLLAELPLPRTAEITLLHVSGGEPDRASAAETLRHAASHLHAHTIATLLETGPVAERILERAAALGSDLIVLGSRGVTRREGVLQGSVAERVLGNAHCAVLVAKDVRAEGAARPSGGGARRPAAA